MGRIPLWCISVRGWICSWGWFWILLPSSRSLHVRIYLAKIITVLFVVGVRPPDIIACACKAVQHLIPWLLEFCFYLLSYLFILEPDFEFANLLSWINYFLTNIKVAFFAYQWIARLIRVLLLKSVKHNPNQLVSQQNLWFLFTPF